MSASRKATRQALGALLTTALTSAWEVYRFQKGDWEGKSPIVAITSASSQRERMTLAGSRATFAFDVHTFVLYSDKVAGWSEEQAEDALDDIEQQVCAAVDANPKTTAWARIAYAEATHARDTVVIGGVTYLHETIPLLINVHT